MQAPDARPWQLDPNDASEDLVRGFPRFLGPYELLCPLGEGGVGIVFRARHQETGAIVALKTARVRASAHVSSIRREILTLYRLQHPGIVRILDGGVWEGRPWYAMELLTGVTLLHSIGSGQGDNSTIPTARFASDSEEGSGPRPLRRRASGGRVEAWLTLFRLLCAPLAYLHGEGIVHRDIKPANIFIRPDGTPVLMDFGLVGRWRGALGRESLEDTQAFGGTLLYMAPEQIRGDLGDARSDLYALGATMYEALTGLAPFDASGSKLAALGRHKPPIPPSEIVYGIPPGVDDLVLRLLARDPRERIGHADDVAAALAALGAGDWPQEGLPRGRAYLYQPRLVGRGDSLSSILEGVESSRKLGGLMLLGGESGIGKTALAAEIARVAYQREYEVLTSECPPADPRRTERTAPLLPFRPLLRHIVEHCQIGGAEVTRRVVGPRQALLRSVEPAFGQLEPASGAVTPPSLPVAAALERLLGALSETIIAFACETDALLLVIDDLHWADGLSLALVARLAACENERAAGRLVMLGTYRSEEAGTWLESLKELPRTLHVELGRLGPEDVGRMMADMLGVAHAPADLARFVAREAEGNPFFVGEYLRAALDAGLLYRDGDGHWHQAERSANAALSLPHSARALVERRLASLSREARALVELAAVIGHEIDTELLLALGERRFASPPKTERDLVAALRELAARHVLVESTPETLVFSHDTVRKVAYESIEADERRALHSLVAEAMESARTDRDQPLERAALLAEHFRAAGDFAHALEYLEQAGQTALRHSAGHEAAHYFRAALRLDHDERLGTPRERRGRWEAALGSALQGTGDLEAGRRHLERAVALFGYKSARTRFGLGVQTLLGVLTQLGHRLADRGNARAPAPPERVALVRAYDHLLQIRYYEAEPLPLVHATLRTLNLAERAGASPELVSAYANTFAGLALSPLLRRLAHKYLARAERALEAARDPAVESYLCLIKGLNAANQGRFSEGEPDLLRSAALAEALGYRRRWEEARSVLAYNWGLRGRTEEALETAEAVYQSSLRGDPQTRCWSLIERAQAKVAFGRAEEACRDLEAAAALAEGLGRDERVWVSGLQAAAELALGDVGRAATLADRTLSLMGRRLPLVTASGAAYAAVADVCVKLYQQAGPGDRARRLRAARRACRALGRFARAFPFMRARAELAEGDLALCLGRNARARAAFAAAAESARSAELLPVEALARGRALPAKS